MEVVMVEDGGGIVDGGRGDVAAWGLRGREGWEM